MYIIQIRRRLRTDHPDYNSPEWTDFKQFNHGEEEVFDEARKLHIHYADVFEYRVVKQLIVPLG